LAVALVALIQVVLSAADGSRHGLVRRFNKHILNPFAMWVAAHRRTYYGVLQHVGRRSRKAYSTPVVAKLTTEGVIIPLPYGPDTDWCRNVLAAGGCTLTLNGAEYALTSPRLLAPDVAEPLVPAVNAQIWRRVGIKQYLSLAFASRVAPPTRESGAARSDSHKETIAPAELVPTT
jgi:deazaflavin-dependent oxidoreductase (nitroreductase family)